MQGSVGPGADDQPQSGYIAPQGDPQSADTSEIVAAVAAASMGSGANCAELLNRLNLNTEALVATVRYAVAIADHCTVEKLLLHTLTRPSDRRPTVTQIFGPASFHHESGVGSIGKTALHLAAMSEQRATTLPGVSAELAAARTVQLLLGHGAKSMIDVVDDQGFTALHYACIGGSTAAAVALLEAGCALEVETPAQDNVLHLACLGGHVETVKMLLPKSRHSELAAGNTGFGWPLRDRINGAGWSPLHLAVMTGQRPENQQCVRLLLDRGANANLVNYDGWTAMLLAASRGMDHILESLIKAGASQDTTRDLGETALHLAALGGEPECVNLLICSDSDSSGSAARRVDAEGNLPLHQAAFSGCAASIRLLLEADSSLVDNTNCAGDTPLHVAAARGHVEATIELLGGTSQVVAARQQQAEMEAQMEKLALRACGSATPSIEEESTLKLSTSHSKWCVNLATGAQHLPELRNGAGVERLELARQLLQRVAGEHGFDRCTHPPGLRFFDKAEKRQVCKVCGIVLDDDRVDDAESDQHKRHSQYGQLDAVPDSGVMVSLTDDAGSQSGQQVLQEVHSLLKRTGSRMSLSAQIRDNAAYLFRQLSAVQVMYNAELRRLSPCAVVAGLLSIASRMDTPLGQARLTREVVQAMGRRQDFRTEHEAAVAEHIITQVVVEQGKLGRTQHNATPPVLRDIVHSDFLPRFAAHLPFGQARGGRKYADGTTGGNGLNDSRLKLRSHYSSRENESDASTSEDSDEDCHQQQRLTAVTETRLRNHERARRHLQKQYPGVPTMPLQRDPPERPKPVAQAIIRPNRRSRNGVRNVFYFEKAARSLLATAPAQTAVRQVPPDVAAAGALLTVGQVGTRRGWRDGSQDPGKKVGESRVQMCTSEQTGQSGCGICGPSAAESEADILLEPLGLGRTTLVDAVHNAYSKLRQPDCLQALAEAAPWFEFRGHFKVDPPAKTDATLVQRTDVVGTPIDDVLNVVNALDSSELTVEHGDDCDVDDVDDSPILVTIRFSPICDGGHEGSHLTRKWLAQLPPSQRALLGTTFAVPVNISAAQLSATLDAIAEQEQEEVCATSSDDMDAQGTKWAYRFWIPRPRAGSEPDMRGVEIVGAREAKQESTKASATTLLKAIEAISGSLERTWRVAVEVSL
eukprot:SAG31_NODE_1771_length_7309_cov_4.269626_2_plen_1153_part_00